MDLRDEINEIFFDDTEVIQEIMKFNKLSIMKVKDKLERTLKTKNPKALQKLLKPIPSMSFDEIKTMLKKRVIKNKAKFDANYKVAQRSIKRIKNKDAKNALSLVAATAATVKDIPVDQIIDENKKVFDPKNLLMLFFGILVLVRDYIGVGGDIGLLANIATSSPMVGITLIVAILMIIKTSYNLIAGKEAKHLLIVV